MTTTTENQVFVTPWDETTPPTEAAILAKFKADGLRSYSWSNSPNDRYGAHTHAFNKVLYVVEGSISFHLPHHGEVITLYAGDRLDLPTGILHSAVVGSDGVFCMEGHRY
ncbi:MAG TPA: hypothetical protein VJZ27_09620 [Aggregatilineales bacterium]|nr:hypothetical protein [Aggregatilineales bacterium]